MIRFIDYDGEFPNLCRGKLTLEIDGRFYRFCYNYKEMKKKHPEQIWCPDFWRSGGGISANSDWEICKTEGPWKDNGMYHISEFPEELRRKIPQMLEVFNENVDWGCCGGCI